MAVNFVVRAEVIDIRAYQPASTDSFLVDTNVWLWLAYSSISHAPSPPLQYQLKEYSPYVQKSLSAKAQLFRCGLSLAEMAHQIEQTERAIYNQYNRLEMTTKEYRRNLADERERVTGEIKTAWEQVKSFSDPREILIDDAATESALANLKQCSLDGYDLFILEAMKKNGIRQIITDDGDFASVPDIRVFTANKKVIDVAKEQGRLIKR